MVGLFFEHNTAPPPICLSADFIQQSVPRNLLWPLSFPSQRLDLHPRHLLAPHQHPCPHLKVCGTHCIACIVCGICNVMEDGHMEAPWPSSLCFAYAFIDISVHRPGFESPRCILFLFRLCKKVETCPVALSPSGMHWLFPCSCDILPISIPITYAPLGHIRGMP